MNAPLQRLFRPLMERRASRLATFLSPHLPRHGRVLDFGCGDGLVGAKLRDSGRLEITGLDVVDYRLTDVALHLYDGGPIPFADDHFDATMAVFALHHTPDPCFYLREITRVTRHTLLILEDTFRNGVELACTRCLDRIGNYVESPHIAVPCTFRSESEWASHFDELGLLTLHQQRFYNHPLSYVVPRHVFYKLSKAAEDVGQLRTTAS